MKTGIWFMACLLCILEFTSCAISETGSVPKHYNLAFSDPGNNSMKLFIHRGAGKYEEIVPVENRYSVDIPEMQGGYSSFMGIKFNQHIPEEYKVVRIMNGTEQVKEISIVEIEQLKKDIAGNYLLNF